MAIARRIVLTNASRATMEQAVPQGRRGRGRPENTTFIQGKDIHGKKKSGSAEDRDGRNGWRHVVCGQCCTGSDKA